MPILANAELPLLEQDIERYNYILNTQTCAYTGGIVHEGIEYKTVEISDTEINGLEDCRVLVMYSTPGDGEIVYSCYFRRAVIPVLGRRVVQIEVRCNIPGLARAAMSQYFLKRYNAVRTDISNTPSGMRMWKRFIKQGKHNFYLADVSIDMRGPHGEHNQNANLPEIYQNLRNYNAGEKIWHDNRKGDVVVVYATKGKLL